VLSAHSASGSERILKIGQYFVKLLTSEQNTHFFGPPCIVQEYVYCKDNNRRKLMAQLSLTNPRDALRHGKGKKLKTVT